jgi:hypothetical protein
VSDRTHAYSYGETEERESEGRKRTQDSQRFCFFWGKISPNGEFFFQISRNLEFF